MQTASMTSNYAAPSRYLLIENVGECPIEGFTILGLSTARGNSSKIGQFGSGAKHAVLLLMREGLTPIIYVGKDKLEFSTARGEMQGKTYNKVLLSVNGAKPQEMGFCLEFGELDWTEINMALREFVSNAIDQNEGQAATLQIVDHPRAKSGTTRVFIPLSDAVKAYYDARGEYFLQYAGKSHYDIMPKSTISQAKFYRKGVFVRAVASHHAPSLFDYNCGEGLRIDESRNLNDYDCESQGAIMVSKSVSALKTIIESFADCVKRWEYNFDNYWLTCGDGGKNLKTAWSQVYSESHIPCLAQAEFDIVQRKGYLPIIVPTQWHKALQKAGVKTSFDCLSSIEKNGATPIETGESFDDCQQTANRVWRWLESLQLTHGKKMPTVRVYEKAMDAGSLKMGYYDAETGEVCINSQAAKSEQTMLEEFAHYITGSTDNSRDFQDFAFLVATKACISLDSQSTKWKS